jgi:hypothetical protein
VRQGRLAGIVIAAAAAWLISAPAAHAQAPAQMLSGLSASYDVAAGAVRATATLDAPPSPAENAMLAVYVGKRDAGGVCDGAMVIAAFTGHSDTSTAWWLNGQTTTAGPPRANDGASVTITATDPTLANQAWDCAWAKTVDPTDTEVEYDRVTGIDLAVTQPPPSPTPAPSGNPPPPAAAKKAARLGVALAGAKPLRRGRWQRVRVRVTNAGDAAARAVTLRIRPGRGAKLAKRRVRVGTLAPGGSRTLRLRVRIRRATALTLIAKSGTLRSRARVPLTLRKRKRPARPPVKPPAGGGLAGRYYTLWEADPMGPGTKTGYMFVDGRWAYRGIPKGGIPTCTRKTAGTDEDGDPTDGCIPYSFERGTLTLDGGPATLSGDKATLKVGEDSFSLTPIVRAGAKLEVSLKSIFVSGYWPYQSVTETWLEMRRNGEFMLSSQTLGSFGLPGTPGSGNFVAVPADQRGTYEVLSRGRLRLAYANGKVEVRTIGIYRDPKTGSADPATDGLWLDDEPFFKDDDD